MSNTAHKILLKDCLIAQKGNKPVVLRSTSFDGAIPYLSINALESGNFKEFTYKELGTVSSEKDILVVWDGSRSGLALKGMSGVIGSTLMGLIPIMLNTDYLYYFLKTNFDFINGNTTGSGIPHVDTELFFNLKIPFATEEYQIEVVDTLKRKLAQNSALLNHQKEVVKNALDSTKIIYPQDENIEITVDNFSQSILNSAFIGDLTKDYRVTNKKGKAEKFLGDYVANSSYKELYDLPADWKWNAMGNVALCRRGRFSARPRNDPKYFTGKHPFIQIREIPEYGGIIKNHRQTLNDEGAVVSKEFKKGTVVIAIVGSSIGNSGVLGYDMFFPDSIVGINALSNFDNDYIALYIQCEKNNFRNLSYSSGGQANLKIEFINNYPIPCPPLAEQKEIVRRTKLLIETAKKIKTNFEDAITNFRDLDKALLVEAFQNIPETTSLTLDQLKSKLEVEKSKIDKIRKEQQKEQSKIRSAMKKDATEIPTLSILDVLKVNNSLPAKEVWEKSKYQGDIDAFYEAIKQIDTNTLSWHIVNEDTERPESVLTLKSIQDED